MSSTAAKKAKGRKLQQHIRDRLYHWFPHLTEGDIRSTSMGAGGEDIQLSPLAKQSIPFAIEAKNTRKTPSIGEIKQARSNSKPGELPLVCWKPHGKQYLETLAIISLEDLMEFFSDRQT